MDIPLTATYVQDGDWIVAWFEEIPGVATQGKTIEEARENLQDALRETLAARHEIAACKAARQAIVKAEIAFDAVRQLNQGPGYDQSAPGKADQPPDISAPKLHSSSQLCSLE